MSGHSMQYTCTPNKSVSPVKLIGTYMYIHICIDYRSTKQMHAHINPGKKSLTAFRGLVSASVSWEKRMLDCVCGRFSTGNRTQALALWAQYSNRWVTEVSTWHSQHKTLAHLAIYTTISLHRHLVLVSAHSNAYKRRNENRTSTPKQQVETHISVYPVQWHTVVWQFCVWGLWLVRWSYKCACAESGKRRKGDIPRT